MTIKPKIAAGVAVAVIAVLVVANLTQGPDRPGDPAVYSRIEQLTDCAALQGEFDAAEARHGAAVRNHRTELAEIETSYMKAADERMRSVGCY